MEARNKLREYLTKGNAKQLAKLLKDLPVRSVSQRVNEELDEDGTTALILCAKALKEGDGDAEDYAECCLLLLKSGANVRAKTTDGQTALHWAVSCCTPTLAAILLSAGADPNQKDQNGINALQLAIKEGSAENVKLILDKRPQLADERDEFGVPPVIIALQQYQEDIVRHLVEAGADVNIQETRNLRTPLHYALYTKKLKILEFLLGHNPDLTKTDHRGTTIVHRSSAIRDKQYLEAVVRLSKAPPDSLWRMADEEGNTAVMLSCQNDNYDQLVILLEQGATVSDHDKYGRTALHHCVENTETECAELLLQTDTSLLNTPDKEGLTPLHMAAITGNSNFLRLLLKKGANLTCRDQEGHTVVHWATVTGHTECLEILIDHDADLSTPDKHKARPIHYAAQIARDGFNTQGKEDSTQVLRLLLQHQVPYDITDKDGRQPLLWAASAGNPPACKILVEAGADPNVVDNDGLTALHCAASRGHTSCMETLLSDCKAKVDPEDRNNCTPLFYAITLGNIDCMKMLVQHRADTAHVDNKGRSPAHCAALKGSQEALRVLLKNKADLWSPSQQGNYPIHEATHGGHAEIVRFFLAQSGNDDVVDLANDDGRTCLHIAALTNNLNICKLLLDADANVNTVMMSKGKYYTPTDAALLKGHRETGDYLISKGGKKGSFITNDAAIIIQRNLKLKSRLRPTSSTRRVKSPKRRDSNRLEVLSPEKVEPREETEEIHIESENVKEEDSKPAPVSATVNLQVQRKQTPEIKDVKSTDSKKTETKPAEKKSPSRNDASVNTDNKSASPRKGILKSTKENGKENAEPMGSSPTKQKKKDVKDVPEVTATNGTADTNSHNSVDSGEFYRASSQRESNTSEPRSRSRMSKSSRILAQEVQASVRRYEEERRAVREYHQLRRAQIYTGPLYDIALFSSSFHQNNREDAFGTHDNDRPAKRQTFYTMSQSSEHVNGDMEFSTRTDDHTHARKAQKAKGKSDSNIARQPSSRKPKKMNQNVNEDRHHKDKDVEQLANQTEQLYTDLNNKAAASVQSARQMNNELRSSFDQDANRGKRATPQNGHSGENETKKSRRERQRDEQKRREEEFHRLLVKAYRPETCLPEQKGKDGSGRGRNTSLGLTRSKTMVSTQGTPSPSRPVSVYSKRSTASQPRPSRPTTTVMTPYGTRKVPIGEPTVLPVIDTKHDEKTKLNGKHQPSPQKESEV
ncbi:inversin-B-like [Haliotis rufescens]|uniref:inversin-B-like n=1 Tax=Haliotis rufescens TaxID=6454 RepID=UPI00201F8B69|nr:inversin-B-like [Haliotis rufescens]